MENNIFDNNMQESVHDAILSWIIRGVNSKNKKSQFYKFSVDFLEMLNINVDENTEVKVKQQYTIDLGKKTSNKRRSNGYIDIFATFTNDNSNERYLVIEDKMYTEENKQFEEYKNGILNDKDIKIISKFENVNFVYVKLGKITPSSKEKSKIFGWQLITIEDIKMILPNCFVNNTHESKILECYRDFLLDLENKYNSYTKFELREWTEYSIFGFYDYLVTEYSNSDFLYKSGYCAFWPGKLPIRILSVHSFNLYFELELYANDTELNKWKYSIKLEDVNNNVDYKLKKELFIELKRVFTDNKEYYYKGYPKITEKSILVQSKKIKSRNITDFKNEIKEQIEIFNNLYKNILDPKYKNDFI